MYDEADDDGEPLTLDNLWHIGFACGVLLLPKSSVYDGLPVPLSAAEEAALLEGYTAGCKATECDLAARVQPPECAPVHDDEFPW